MEESITSRLEYKDFIKTILNNTDNQDINNKSIFKAIYKENSEKEDINLIKKMIIL